MATITVFTLLTNAGVIDANTATIGTMIVNFGMLFYLQRTIKATAVGMLGHSKLKWQCLVCQGTKFDSKGTCHRCGGKSRRPI